MFRRLDVSAAGSPCAEDLEEVEDIDLAVAIQVFNAAVARSPGREHGEQVEHVHGAVAVEVGRALGQRGNDVEEGVGGDDGVGEADLDEGGAGGVGLEGHVDAAVGAGHVVDHGAVEGGVA